MEERDRTKREVLSNWTPDCKEPQGLSGQRKENGVMVKNMNSRALDSNTGYVILGKLSDLFVQL